jgi:uncharacterized membrane protein YedE/YeeE
MKNAIYIIMGIIFGIVLTKSEAISWFRIQEMFRFQSFHMYGIIGSAVVLGALAIQLIKIIGIKDINGLEIKPPKKEPRYFSAILGGSIFGLGWALVGACPGPLYILLGSGYLTILIALLAAVLGTIAYGFIRNRLPH